MNERLISNEGCLNDWGWTDLNTLNIVATFSVESIAKRRDNSYHRFAKYAAADPKDCYNRIRENSVSPFRQFNCFIDGHSAKEIAIEKFDKYENNCDFTTNDSKVYVQVTYFCIDDNGNLYIICKTYYDINQ